MKFKIFLVAALLSVLTLKNAAAEDLPLDYFFKNPEFAGFQLSPNGKELAAMVNLNDRMNLAIIDLKTRKARAVTNEKKQDVSGFMWATNERLLFFMDKDGSESFGIFAVNSDGSMPRTLVEPLDSVIKSGGKSKLRIVSVLDVLEDEPDWVLVSSNERRAAYPDVFRMNIMNGKTSLVERNPGHVTGWFTDWDGNVTGAAFQDELEVGFMLLRDPEADEWETITQTRFDAPSFMPAGISGDGKNGYVSSNLTPEGEARDKSAIYEYNFETKTFGKLVYEHPVVDCCSLILNRKMRDMIGVSYMVGEPEVVYLDEDWKNTMAAIDQAMPDTTNRLISLDDAETIGVIAASSSTQPPRYFLFDFVNRKLEWMADSRPWVDSSKMSEMKPYSFQARDGRLLHGYLTVPVGSIKHAKVMEKALKKSGVDYELMVKRDEGHGFRKEENRYDFYGKMDTFLAEHLKPAKAASANP